MKGKGLKILGIIAAIGGVGISLLTSWIGDKKLDQKITTEVTKQLTGKN